MDCIRASPSLTPIADDRYNRQHGQLTVNADTVISRSIGVDDNSRFWKCDLNALLFP